MSIVDDASVVTWCRILLDAANLLHDPSWNSLMFGSLSMLLFGAFFDKVQRTSDGGVCESNLRLLWLFTRYVDNCLAWLLTLLTYYKARIDLLLSGFWNNHS